MCDCRRNASLPVPVIMVKCCTNGASYGNWGGADICPGCCVVLVPDEAWETLRIPLSTEGVRQHMLHNESGDVSIQYEYYSKSGVWRTTSQLGAGFVRCYGGLITRVQAAAMASSVDTWQGRETEGVWVLDALYGSS